VLCHGDPAAPNCFRGNERVGFLDWEIAHVGDPARELHRARDQLIDPPRAEGSEEVVAGLHEGYRDQVGGLPASLGEREAIYEAVRFLGVSGFFERWAATREESSAALAEWVEKEMDRRLTEIR
jgi:aminoglycoside phosphotransferase (APT) family kinase protein